MEIHNRPRQQQPPAPPPRPRLAPQTSSTPPSPASARLVAQGAPGNATPAIARLAPQGGPRPSAEGPREVKPQAEDQVSVGAVSHDAEPLEGGPLQGMRAWVAEGGGETASRTATTEPAGQTSATLSERAGDAATMASAAHREVRGELNAPLRSKDAFGHYKGLEAADLAGKDDIRLQQMNRVAAADNAATVQRIDSALRDAGVEGQVYGRAKSPESMFGKLMETDGMRVGDIKDMSGARVDLKMQRPGFEQVYEARQAVQGVMGEAYKTGKDYIAHPNPWGYTGRIHDGISGSSVPNTELQYGSRDLSRFIDGKVTNASGQSRSLHDLTGYKGELYGARVPEHLQSQYPQLMREIAANDVAGRTLEQAPELSARIDRFRAEVTETLPDRFKAPPEPELGRAARLKGLAGKGLGALGAAGGGLQASQGVQELGDGKYVEGTGNLASGASNVLAGGAMMMGRVALGTTASGVAASIDGGKDIIVGIRDGNTEKTVVGAVKTGAGAAMMAGVATANPPLIAGGAIAYGGAVAYESREAIADGASYVGTKAYEGAAYVGSKTYDGVSYAGGKAYEGATYVVGKAYDGAAYVGGKAYDGAAYVGGKAYDGAAYVGGKAYDGLASMGGWVTGWFGR